MSEYEKSAINNRDYWLQQCVESSDPYEKSWALDKAVYWDIEIALERALDFALKNRTYETHR